MPPDNKQPVQNNANPPTTPSVAQPIPNPTQGQPRQNQEPRFLSFENVLSQKGRETPEDLKAGIRLLRTYQSDVAEAMKGDAGSLVKMAIAENERKDRDREEMTKRLMQEKTAAMSEPVLEVPPAIEVEPLEPQIREAIITKVQEPLEKRLSTPESRSADTLSKTIESGLSQKKFNPTNNASQLRSAPYQTSPELLSPQSSGRIGSSEAVVKKTRITIPLILSTFFFLLGGGALFLVYTKLSVENPMPGEVTPISFSDYQDKVLTDGFTRVNLVASIDSLKSNTTYTAGSILNIVLVETDSTLTKDGKRKDRLLETPGLFSLLNTRATPSFIRSLDPEFVLGLHIINDGEPFLILKSNFYDSAFSGMLSLETTMAADLLEIFTRAKPPVATSTETYIGDKVGDWNDTFEDKVVKNKDVRILKDSAGKTVLLYSFINKETLVITTNEDTFNEIYNRLTVTVFKR